MRMRRILAVLAVVFLVVGVMATASTAWGQGGGHEFEVTVHVNPDAEVIYDWGWTMNEELTTTDGEHLGWSQAACFNLSGDPEIIEEVVCTFGMRFPDGDITVGGALSIAEWFEGDTVVPVTGGTGMFRHITGEVAIIPADDFETSTLVFRVKRAGVRY